MEKTEQKIKTKMSLLKIPTGQISKNRNEIKKGKERCKCSSRKLFSRRILVMDITIGGMNTLIKHLNKLSKKP
jgi:hypothetical protein